MGCSANGAYYCTRLPGHNFRLTNLQAAMDALSGKHPGDRRPPPARFTRCIAASSMASPGVTLHTFDARVMPCSGPALKLDPALFHRAGIVSSIRCESWMWNAGPGFYAQPAADL